MRARVIVEFVSVKNYNNIKDMVVRSIKESMHRGKNTPYANSNSKRCHVNPQGFIMSS